MERILNFAELLEVLDTSHPTARKLIRTGQIRAVRVGREYRVLESAVVDFLRGGVGVGSGKEIEGADRPLNRKAS